LSVSNDSCLKCVYDEASICYSSIYMKDLFFSEEIKKKKNKIQTINIEEREEKKFK